MAVSDRQCNWFGFAYFLVFGGSIAICVYNSIEGKGELGNNTRLADAFASATTVIAAVTTVCVGLELIMRSSMSAFLVYPCEFQKRSFCCWDYTMPTFWLLSLVLTLVNLIVSVAITVLIIVMVGMGAENGFKIVRAAVVVGICLIDVIVSAISLKMSRTCLAKEKAEEETDMFDEETVPLEPALEDYDIPKSPMVRSPMLGESPIQRPNVMPGTPSHQVAMNNLNPTMSPRWNSSLGLAKSPANPYAAHAMHGSQGISRYSPTVRQHTR